jgi:hypothetical protein
MREDDIKDIVEQLQRLQIQQDVLLARLGELSGSHETPAQATRVPPDTTRDLAIGDRVRIRNPGRFQAVRGTIVRIGTSRITVQARNGSKIIRAPHNLFLEDE